MPSSVVKKFLPGPPIFGEKKSSNFVDVDSMTALFAARLRLIRDDDAQTLALVTGTPPEREDRAQHVANYVRQALTFDDAAALTNGTEKALHLYYFALNLAKAGLMTTQPEIGGAFVGHGLKVEWNASEDIRDHELVVGDGVFGRLFTSISGQTLIKGTRFKMPEILALVPETFHELGAVDHRFATDQ